MTMNYDDELVHSHSHGHSHGHHHHLGAKKVEDYGIGMGIITVLINIVTPVLGFFCATGLAAALYQASA